MKKILSFIFTIVLLGVCHAQEVSLAFSLKKGGEYKQVTTTKSSINQEANGMSMNIDIIFSATMLFKVIDIENENYVMEVKYTDLSMKTDMPQVSMEYSSSTQNEDDIMSSMLSKLTGKPFMIKMSKYGKVSDVKNMELLIESLFDGISDVPAVQLEQMKSQLDQSYGADAFKANIEQTTAIFPDKKVKKGDKWNIGSSLKTMIVADISSEFELVETGADYNIIKGNSTMKSKESDEYFMNNGMPMKFNLNGTITSEIKLDSQTGWIIEAKIIQNIKGEAEIKDNPQVPGGMKLPMGISSEMMISN